MVASVCSSAESQKSFLCCHSFLKFGKIFLIDFQMLVSSHIFLICELLSLTTLVISKWSALQGQFLGLWTSVGTRISKESDLAHSLPGSLPLNHLSPFFSSPAFGIRGRLACSPDIPYMDNKETEWLHLFLICPGEDWQWHWHPSVHELELLSLAFW